MTNTSSTYTLMAHNAQLLSAGIAECSHQDNHFTQTDIMPAILPCHMLGSGGAVV